MKTIVTETALEAKFWSAAIRTAAYFLRNGFTVPQPRPKYICKRLTSYADALQLWNFILKFQIFG